MEPKAVPPAVSEGTEASAEQLQAQTSGKSMPQALSEVMASEVVVPKLQVSEDYQDKIAKLTKVLQEAKLLHEEMPGAAQSQEKLKPSSTTPDEQAQPR